MPIEIVAVSKADFDKWLGEAKKKFAAAPEGAAPALVAAASRAGERPVPSERRAGN